MTRGPRSPRTRDVPDTTAESQSHRGLATAEAERRLAESGPNALPERPPESTFRRLARQFASPLIYILLFALAFDVGLWAFEGFPGWPVEATAIGLILLFNGVLGFFQEKRSEAALNRLKAMAGSQALRRRPCCR